MPRSASNKLKTFLFHAMAVATMVIVPLSFTTATLDPGIHLRFTVWAATLAIIGGLVIRVWTRDRSLGNDGYWRSGLFWMGLLYLAATIASGIVAINLPDWLYATLRTTLLLVHMSLFALILLWNRERLALLAWYAAGIGLLTALIGILQWGGGLFRIGGLDPPYGTMMHENLFATYLFLTTPLTLFGAIRYKGLSRWFFVLALIVIAVAEIASTTRAAWAALTLGLVFTALVYVIADRRLGVQTIGKTGIQKRIAALLLVAVLLVGAGIFLANVSDQFDDLLERTLLWKRTVQLAADHPFLGLGAGNWVQYTNIENMRSRISQANWIRPHNDPLWVVSETGVLGLIGYLGLFVVAFWMLWRTLRETEDRELRLFALAAMYALIGFFLVSNSGFERERIEHTALFATVLALAYVVYRQAIPAADKQPRRSRLTPVLAGLSVTIAIFSVVVGVYRVQGETHITNAHMLMGRDQWAAAIPEIDAAENPFYTAHPNGLSTDYMRGICLYELGRFPEARDNFIKSYQYNSGQLMAIWWLARSYLRTGQFQESAEMFSYMLEIWPDSIFALPGLALSKYELGEYEDAFRYLYRYRAQYDPQRHRTKYDKIWAAIRAKLGPEKTAELDSTMEFESRELRRAQGKRGMTHPEIIGEK